MVLCLRNDVTILREVISTHNTTPRPQEDISLPQTCVECADSDISSQPNTSGGPSVENGSGISISNLEDSFMDLRLLLGKWHRGSDWSDEFSSIYVRVGS